MRGERWAGGLDPGLAEGAGPGSMLGAGDPARFDAWPVSRAVNSPRNEGAELVEPLDSGPRYFCTHAPAAFW